MKGIDNFKDFFHEIWRRRVLQVAIPYGLGGWALVQVAEIVLDAFEAPPWVMQGLLLLLLAGFPVAVILAWIFDFSPGQGLVRTSALDEEEAQAEPEAEPEPAPSVALELGDSERRQVTQMSAVFDVLSSDDPEQQREFVSQLRQACHEMAERFEARLLRFGADELTLLFGYPQAREDDARRAVAAGLDLIERVAESSGPGLDVQARIGVSTGLVVIEESKEEGGELTLIGQVPRMAHWLLNLAAPGSVIIGPYTQRLVNSYFELDDGQEYAQTPFNEALTVYNVVEATSARRYLETVDELMGRNDDLEQLSEGWAEVCEGDGRFVLLQGEPGIGKSTLLGAFVRTASESGEMSFVPGQCSPQHRNNPLAPVITALREHILEIEEDDDEEQQWEKLQEFVQTRPGMPDEALGLIAHLLAFDDRADAPVPAGSPQIVRMQTMELLLDLLSAAASRKPLLMVVEDLHWADPSTLEMIDMMIARGPAPGLFVLLTARPYFEADWIQRADVHVHPLQPLSRRTGRALIEATAEGIELPSALIKRILEETDGNPLFIRELTLAVLESDDWQRYKDEGDSPDLARLAIPATLKDSLAARVDNLGSGKALLQLCSVLGQEFIYTLLREVSATENEPALKKELSHIVSAGLLYQRGVLSNLTYKFKHILILETAYHSLLRSKRIELHARTAEILEKEVPDLVQRQPALLAWHYSEAGDYAKAVAYWTLASRQSLDNFANLEAIEQASNGIKMLAELPEDSALAAQELPLQAVLGSALLSTRGYADPKVQQAFMRAQNLCDQIGDAPQLFQVVVGLWMYYVIAGEYGEANEQSQRLLRIAESTEDPAQLLQARYSQAFVDYNLGRLKNAEKLLKAAVEGEVPDLDYAAQSASGDDTRLHVRVLLATVSWHLGRSKSANKLITDANRIAKKAGHPWGRTFALFYSTWYHQMKGEPGKTLEYAGETLKIAQEMGFRFWLALAGFMQAWAANRDVENPRWPMGAEGVMRMQELLDAHRATGAGNGYSYLSYILAQEYIGLGEAEDAAGRLESGFQAAQDSGERYYEPEYYRLQGLMLLERYGVDGEPGERDEAESLFQKAQESARDIGSRALELRATLDLARLLLRCDEPDLARQRLEQVLETFDEQDGSPDFETAARIIKKTKQ